MIMNYLLVKLFLIFNVLAGLALKKDRKDIHYYKETRILGGIRVNISKAPFMASLILQVRKERDHLLCGAVIIGKRWALTAASCLDLISEKLIRYHKVILRSATTTWTNKSQTKKDHNIIQVKKHEKYQGEIDNYDNNIAILKIDPTFSANTEKPIAFATEHFKYNDESTGTVYGWGLVDPDAPYNQPLLMKANLELYSRQKCQQLLNYYHKGEKLTKSQFCTQGSYDGNYCIGDEGGPIVQNRTIIGLMSWSRDCSGDASTSSIFTKLSKFNSWIYKQMDVDNN